MEGESSNLSEVTSVGAFFQELLQLGSYKLILSYSIFVMILSQHVVPESTHTIQKVIENSDDGGGGGGGGGVGWGGGVSQKTISLW